MQEHQHVPRQVREDERQNVHQTLRRYRGGFFPRRRLALGKVPVVAFFRLEHGVHQEQGQQQQQNVDGNELVRRQPHVHPTRVFSAYAIVAGTTQRNRRYVTLVQTGPVVRPIEELRNRDDKTDDRRRVQQQEPANARFLEFPFGVLVSDHHDENDRQRYVVVRRYLSEEFPDETLERTRRNVPRCPKRTGRFRNQPRSQKMNKERRYHVAYAQTQHDLHRHLLDFLFALRTTPPTATSAAVSDVVAVVVAKQYIPHDQRRSDERPERAKFWCDHYESRKPRPHNVLLFSEFFFFALLCYVMLH